MNYMRKIHSEQNAEFCKVIEICTHSKHHTSNRNQYLANYKKGQMEVKLKQSRPRCQMDMNSQLHAPATLVWYTQ